MNENRALRVYGRDDLRLEASAVPTPSQNEALVRIRYGGVCGSDLHYVGEGAVGLSVLRAPMVLGHEVVGTVVASAADGSGPAPGQAVAVHPATACGTCRFCLAGQPRLCPEGRYLGSAAHYPHTEGAFTDLVAVATARLIRVPAGLSLERAALAEPTSIAWHAVSRADHIPPGIGGADVLVVGAGPIGLLVTAVARHRGAGRITAVDVHRRPLEVAQSIGADRAMTADELAAGSEVEADIVFESSGSLPGLRTALRSTRKGGTLVVVGQPPAGEQPVEVALVVGRELTVVGSLRMDSELEPAVAFLADPSVELGGLVSHILPVAQADEAFALARDAARSSKVLLDFG
jgi:L-idonate 5-dehydrogenase